MESLVYMAGEYELISDSIHQVHTVHAVPAGDRAGPPGEPLQLPDDGRGTDGAGRGQCVAARRGHRRRRSPGPGRQVCFLYEDEEDCSQSNRTLDLIDRSNRRKVFLVSDKMHPQTLAVMRTRVEVICMRSSFAYPVGPAGRFSFVSFLFQSIRLSLIDSR